MKIYCVFSLESPHRGDSYEYTKYTIFNIKKKLTLNYPKAAAMGFFQGTQERAISVRATEVLLYIEILSKRAGKPQTTNQPSLSN